MARDSRPLGQSEFAVALRALHERAGRPAQEDIGSRAGSGHRAKLTHSAVGLILRGQYTPPWETASAIITALGGDPAEFRAAWEASDPKTVTERSPDAVRSARSLIARADRLGDDIRAWLEGAVPESPVPGLPLYRLAEYRLGGAGRSVSVWHAASRCAQTGIVSDLGAAVDWAVEHEREAHGDGA